MPETSFGPDLADILTADGTLQPAPHGDLNKQLILARDTVRDAYRIAFQAAGGDLEDSVVDTLDMVENLIRDAIDHSARTA